MATRMACWGRLAAAIPSNWLVLEIGGGPDPWPRSDVLVERTPFDNTERAGNAVIDRPSLACDAEALPFGDKVFDFVFCAQVLEHADDPTKFLSEIQRVGKAGYLETPKAVRELLFGWPYHKWIVEQEARKLTLRPNNIPQVCGSFFHELQVPEWVHFVRMNHELLNNMLRWEGRIDFEVASPRDYCAVRGSDKVLQGNTLWPNPRAADRPSWGSILAFSLGEGVIARLKRVLRYFQRTRSGAARRAVELSSLLVCPSCHGVLERPPSGYRCGACGVDYATKGGIPHLLPTRLDPRGSRAGTQ